MVPYAAGDTKERYERIASDPRSRRLAHAVTFDEEIRDQIRGLNLTAKVIRPDAPLPLRQAYDRMLVFPYLEPGFVDQYLRNASNRCVP